MTAEPSRVSARLTDPAFLAFLRARREEEAAAAASAGPDRAARLNAGLALLDEHIANVEAGRDLEFVQLELLKIAYSRHPDFRPEWHPTKG